MKIFEKLSFATVLLKMTQIASLTYSLLGHLRMLAVFLTAIAALLLRLFQEHFPNIFKEVCDTILLLSHVVDAQSG